MKLLLRRRRRPPALLSAWPPSLLAQEAGHPPDRLPGPSTRRPAWASSFAEAVERARAIKDGRILVEFATSRCPELRPDGEARLPGGFVPGLHARQGRRSSSRSADARGKARSPSGFGVRSAPAWLVLTPDLLLCGKQEGESNQSGLVRAVRSRSERGWAAFRRKLDEEKKAPADTRPGLRRRRGGLPALRRRDGRASASGASSATRRRPVELRGSRSPSSRRSPSTPGASTTPRRR